MSFKGVFKKIIKVTNTISIIGGVIGIIILAFFFLSGDSSANKQAYIDVVKGIEIQGQSMEEVVEEIMYLRNGRDPSADWDIVGETDQGKVVTATGKTNKVTFYTIKNGDYIQLDANNIIIEGEGYETISLSQMYYNKLTGQVNW
ncbi:hypothetical protein PM10SUCC1_32990 [Propionigenium maris DSM 9537]|uniref:Uncharacterized protein n=1 Tax=Propionigenium maris DSM 9537 TaxID=1123000 RepID=A0A9W6LQ22_9FUSO|nr:hypothetical protein [Propionigenium maris]GLI57785.1 hypothetical protein PM10SUCC1_32990 [Propionigenium maris DSM 9537]